MNKYDNIPQELKNVKQWVCWTSDKLPKNPYTGGNAQSNNKSTWSDFNTAVKACEKYGFKGIGFMFSPPYFGVDLDKCLDNDELIEEFVETLQSYTEISKSGNGIHIICKGTLPNGNRRRDKVEMYSERRYFIMTGNLYNEKYKTIVDCSETIKPLHAKYLGDITPKIAPKIVEPLDLSDEEIIDRARNCKTGQAFQFLYSGNWQGIYHSQSEADLALCNQLAFWTQRDAARMDRIFRSSGLMRAKWDSKRGAFTYGEKTIERAISACTEVYEPKAVTDDASLAVEFFRNGGVRGLVPKNNYDLTDTGNAQRMHDKFVGNIKYSYVNKKWYYWTGKVWTVDYTGEIKKLADTIINDIKKAAFAEQEDEVQEAMLKWANKTSSSKGKEAMVRECQHLEGIPVLPDEMDSFTDYLNCQNGIINLRNGELMPHDSSFMMTKCSHAEYDNTSDKQPQLWFKFLDDVTNGDKELQRYLQKCIGYSLTGSTREQCAFFLYGGGNNGKSTFLDIVSELLGSYSANVQPKTIMSERNNDSGANSDIARLKSTRFVTSEESDEGVRLNEGLIKQLTGSSKVTCRFLYGDEFEYEPEFKIWMGTNNKPVIRGTDFGIWRRIRLIPFEVNIPKEKIDKNLKYKLRKELPQILNWAVKGCIMWQKEGLEMPKSVEKATSDYKNEMDMLAAFCDACLNIDYQSNNKIMASDLFEVYSIWAKKNNEYMMTSKKFFNEISKKLPEKQRGASGMYYTKIMLTDYAKNCLGNPSSKVFKISDFKN